VSDLSSPVASFQRGKGGAREGIAGERDDRWGQAIGERERGKLGWAGSGVSWAGWLPSVAQVGCWFFLFIFFFLFSFSFVFDFCFGF
jgi:hypothetical protein